MTTRTPSRGNTTHQRKMHLPVTAAGYAFQRVDSKGHNHYYNEHGQKISVPGTPQNEGHSLRFIMAEIKRHQAQREATMPSSAPTKVDPVDLYMTLADPFLLREPVDNAGRKARNTAAIGFARRVVEKFGPVKAVDLNAALERCGIARTTAERIRGDAQLLSYRVFIDNKAYWMNCLDYQIPEGAKVRRDQLNRNIPQHDVQVEQPEPKPGTDPAVAKMPGWGTDQAGSVTEVIGVPTVGKQQSYEQSDVPMPNGNGTSQLSDQQAAALMLLESLGMKPPGGDVKQTLIEAHAALRDAYDALQSVKNKLEAAITALS